MWTGSWIWGWGGTSWWEWERGKRRWEWGRGKRRWEWGRGKRRIGWTSWRTRAWWRRVRAWGWSACGMISRAAKKWTSTSNWKRASARWAPSSPSACTTSASTTRTTRLRQSSSTSFPRQTYKTTLVSPPSWVSPSPTQALSEKTCWTNSSPSSSTTTTLSKSTPCPLWLSLSSF